MQNIVDNDNFNSDNYSDLKKFEEMYEKLFSDRFRNFLINKIQEDFQLQFSLRTHFICRLMCRFKNTPIEFIIRDIKRIYKLRKSKFNIGKKTIFGDTCGIIYDNSKNEIVTIFKNTADDKKLWPKGRKCRK